MTGRVYLVGAGPGDPDLLTVRALRILRQADVVLYDRLVGSRVLELVNPLAQRIYVGKHEGEQQRVQGEIHALLLRFVREGRTVVRLKGGDPFVFGRGGEEWAALVRQGVPVEVVPGLSSALALPALAGIPLTCRGVSGGFAVVTGHREGRLARGSAAGEAHWRRYAAAETLVVLMGVKRRAEIARALIDAGRPPHEPVAFIESGCSPEQRVIEATLEDVAGERVEVVPPAVWIAGEVVAWRHRLSSRHQILAGSPGRHQTKLE